VGGHGARERRHHLQSGRHARTFKTSLGACDLLE
jgi:hypothetical protein